MFRNAFQSGFLSILYSVGSTPLAIWGRHVKNGHIKRLADEDVKSLVLEVAGTNVATTYIFCPADPKMSLGVRLSFLVMIIKNLNKYFSFEITVLDNKSMRRRLRASNYQSTTRVRQFSCSTPMGLNPGWNQCLQLAQIDDADNEYATMFVQFNLADFTRRAYGTDYVETVSIQIHANCRLRRVYFADRLYSEDDVPPEYRLLAEERRRSDTGAHFGNMTSASLTAAMQCPGVPPPGQCGGDNRGNNKPNHFKPTSNPESV